MKRVIIFFLVMIIAATVWYSSLLFVPEIFVSVEVLQANAGIYASIHLLFFCLAIAAIVFAIITLALDIKMNNRAIEQNMQSNKLHLEVIAITSLIQECDVTLHRYDRWEEAGIRGDYASAKADVRDKMNAHKDRLENVLQQIQTG